MLKLLVVGDIIGNSGRKILKKYLDKNRLLYDFIIINGENAAGGFGITIKIANELFNMGVDIITSGNHIWDQKEIYKHLDNEKRILRPLNYPVSVPGKGFNFFEKNGKKLAVVNLQGRIFMNEIDSPFTRIKEELPKIKEYTKNIVIDFHAEASSEKMAMAWYLDGAVSLVYGTHTHVQTSDNKILNKKTGYITDIGMTGGHNGVIGMDKDAIIQKFLDSLPKRFEVCEENLRLNGIEVILNDNGQCEEIRRIDKGIDEI